jgi:hypothetical protein
MTSRYISYLIEDVRLSTENTDFSDTIGIKDTEFLRFLNDGQQRIQNTIVQQHPQVFLKEKTVSVTGDQEAYSLPIDAYLGNKVSQVEFNPQSTGKEYFYPLRPASLFERDSGSNGDPIKYIRQTGKILLIPIPDASVGQLRYNYVQKLPRLALRRGSVSSVTLDSNTNTVTALSLDVSTDSVDTNELSKWTRVSIVDEEGNVKMKNIKVTNVDGSTGVVSVDPSFSYEDGETIGVGNYIVEGSYSSTHVLLDEMVERYLIAYATFKILQRDSNITDLQVQQNVLLEMESEIAEAYAEISDDIMEIPQIISYDDDWVL